MEKQRKNFFHIGQLVVLSILQDGHGLPIFSDVVTDNILNGKSSVYNTEDLNDRLKKKTLEKVCNSETENVNAIIAEFVYVPHCDVTKITILLSPHCVDTLDLVSPRLYQTGSNKIFSIESTVLC